MRNFIITLAFLVIIPNVISCTNINREEGYAYFRLKTDPSTLDPAYIVDVTGGSLSAKLFNGLVRIDHDLSIVPDIAESWNISPDGMVYEFHLRDDATFSNGRTVKASDFIYSFERMLDPKNNCPNIWVLDKIKGVEAFRSARAKGISGLVALNDRTLRITLERSFNPFLSLLSMPSAYVVPKEEILSRGDSFGFEPVGSGPYKLKKWEPNVEIIFESRDDYFSGTPKVKGLAFRIIPEDLTAVTEFEVGNIDTISLPASAFGRFTRDPEWSGMVVAQEGLNTYYLGFNCQRPPFDNVNIRRAVGYSLDRRKILNTFFENRGRAADGPVPDNLRNWNIDVRYDHNPDRAIEILRSEGITLPVKADLYITADQDVVDMAEVIQSYLNRSGFDVRIKQLEWSSYKQALNRGEADMFWLSWWADYPDPENFLYPLFHSSNLGPAGNRVRFIDERVDRLIEQGQRAVSDEERNRYYGRAENIIMSKVPWIPFWHRNDHIIRQKRVKEITIAPIYSSDKGMEISLSEAARPDN